MESWKRSEGSAVERKATPTHHDICTKCNRFVGSLKENTYEWQCSIWRDGMRWLRLTELCFAYHVTNKDLHCPCWLEHMLVREMQLP